MTDKDAFATILQELAFTATKLAGLKDELDQLLGPLEAGVHGFSLTQNLKIHILLKWLSDFGKELEKPYNTHGRTIRRIANEMMEDDDIEQIDVDGVRFKPVIKDRFNVTAEMHGAFIEWLKERNPEIVREDVHPRTRDSFLKECLEDGVPLPQSVTHFPEPDLNQRRLPRR